MSHYLTNQQSDVADDSVTNHATREVAVASAAASGNAGETPWLSVAERQMWVRLVGLTLLLPNAVERNLKRDAGTTFFEYHVLAMLSEAPERTRLMSDLAQWSNASLSRLSHVVKRLEAQGWVQRVACPNDGRATNAVLTDAGFAHLERHAPEHVREVRRLVFDHLLPGDVGQLGEILGRMFVGIDPEQRQVIV